MLRRLEIRISLFQGPGRSPNKAVAPELYNFKSDPSERHNRAKEFPEIVADLKEKMRTFKIEGAEMRF